MADSDRVFSTEEVNEIDLKGLLILVESQRIQFECQLSTITCNTELRLQKELKKEREQAELRLQKEREERKEELKNERKERKEAVEKLSRECESLREGLRQRAGDDTNAQHLSIPSGTDEEDNKIHHAPADRTGLLPSIDEDEEIIPPKLSSSSHDAPNKYAVVIYEVEVWSTKLQWHRSTENDSVQHPSWVRPHQRPIPNALYIGKDVANACPIVPHIYSRNEKKNEKWEWETEHWRFDKKRSRQIKIGEKYSTTYQVSQIWLEYKIESIQNHSRSGVRQTPETDLKPSCIVPSKLNIPTTCSFRTPIHFLSRLLYWDMFQSTKTGGNIQRI